MRGGVSSRLAAAALMAAMASIGQGDPFETHFSKEFKPRKPGKPTPKMVTSDRSEIQAWNAGIDQRKAEKKAKKKG